MSCASRIAGNKTTSRDGDNYDELTNYLEVDRTFIEKDFAVRYSESR